VSASGPARPGRPRSGSRDFGAAGRLGDVAWVLRRPAAVPFVDLAQAVVLNLVAAALAPPGWQTQVIAVSWVYLIGTVALFTLLRGVVSGVSSGSRRRSCSRWSCRDFPEGGRRHRGTSSRARPRSLYRSPRRSWCLPWRARDPVEPGESSAALPRTGAAAEPPEMHDTVLQVLESLALTSAGDAVEPAVRLAEVRAKARQQAALLRRRLDDVGRARARPVRATGFARERDVRERPARALRGLGRRRRPRLPGRRRRVCAAPPGSAVQHAEAFGHHRSGAAADRGRRRDHRRRPGSRLRFRPRRPAARLRHRELDPRQARRSRRPRRHQFEPRQGHPRHPLGPSPSGHLGGVERL